MYIDKRKHPVLNNVRYPRHYYIGQEGFQELRGIETLFLELNLKLPTIPLLAVIEKSLQNVAKGIKKGNLDEGTIVGCIPPQKVIIEKKERNLTPNLLVWDGQDLLSMSITTYLRKESQNWVFPPSKEVPQPIKSEQDLTNICEKERRKERQQKHKQTKRNRGPGRQIAFRN